MQKILSFLALLLFLLAAASTRAAYISDLTDGQAVFEAFAYEDQTLNISDATTLGGIGVGTVYQDYGHAVVTQLRDSQNQIVKSYTTSDPYNIWVEWVITSEITSISGNVYYLKYLSGTLKAYVGSTDWDFGSSASPFDDVGPSITQPLLVAHVVPSISTGYIIYDQYNNLVFRNAHVGFSAVFWDTTYINSQSLDLGTLANQNLLLAFATESAASGLSNFQMCGGYICTAASGSGSLRLAAMPEPATGTLMLAGLALAGTGAALRRKF